MNWNTRYAEEQKSDVQPYQVTGLRPYSPSERASWHKYRPGKPIPPGIRKKNSAPDRSGVPLHEAYPFYKKFMDRRYPDGPNKHAVEKFGIDKSYEEFKTLTEITKRVHKNPDAPVTIRRLVVTSVGATTINPRDWASFSPTWGANFFKKDGVTPRARYKDRFNVLVKQVPASHLYIDESKNDLNRKGGSCGSEVAYIPPFPKSI